jgi:hypothetical protein
LSFAATAHGGEQPVDLVDRKGAGIIIIADPVAHFFVAFVLGVVDGLYKIVESRDASTIFRWTRELTIGADRIRHIQINWKPLLQDDAMLPAIAKIISVEGFGANPAQDIGETYRALVLHRRHPHKPVVRMGLPEVPSANRKFVHVAVLPPHRGLQHIVQQGQGQISRHQQSTPDRRARAEQSDLELIDFGQNRGPFGWHIKLPSRLRYGAQKCDRSAIGGRCRIC